MKIIVNYFIGNLPALNFLIVDKTPGWERGTSLYGQYYVRPQRVRFSAVLVINWVSILAILPQFWS